MTLTPKGVQKTHLLQTATTIARVAAVAMLALASLATDGVQARTDVPQLQRQTVFVASTRVDDGTGPRAAQNSDALRLTTYTTLIPGSHRPGASNPSFTLTQDKAFADTVAFSNATVQAALAEKGTREVVVFVHGASVSFERSVERALQIAADFNIPASIVLFAWPSRATFSSANYASDVARAADAVKMLEELLRSLARSDATRIVIVAHSHGVTLAMNTLAGMRQQGASAFFRKFGGIALFSPDMAIDDFAAALESMSPLTAPVVAYVSGHDSALRLLADVTDHRKRLGSVTGPDEVEGLRFTLIDVTAMPTGGALGHQTVMTQPAVIAAINSMPRPDFIRFADALETGHMKGVSVEFAGTTRYIVLQNLPR